MNTSVYYILRNDEMSRWRSFSFDTFLSSLNHHLPKKIKVQKWKSLSSPREFNVFLMSSVHHHIVRQKKRMLVQTQIKMASLVSILPGRVVSIVLNSWTVSGFISFSTITIYKSADSRLNNSTQHCLLDTACMVWVFQVSAIGFCECHRRARNFKTEISTNSFFSFEIMA